MKSKAAALLRIAAALAFIQFAAHTYLHVTAVPTHGVAEVAVVNAMKAERFVVSGNLRSYWDYYFGYGLFASFNCLVETILFLILASWSKQRPVGSAIALMIAANAVYAALVWRFFFYLPMLFDLALIVVLSAALIVEKRVQRRISA
jgi:hypothetical protein